MPYTLDETNTENYSLRTEEDKTVEIVSSLDETTTSAKDSSDTITATSLSTNLLQGGTPISTHIDPKNISYLAPEDEELINITKINSTVDEYITNYNSERYTQYKASFNQIYSKYNKIAYQIKNGKHSIIVSKIVNKKNAPTSLELIYELIKPQIIQYDTNTFIQMVQDISNSRAQLKFDYDTLITKLDLTDSDKKDFEKKKYKFIKMIEKYYTYTLYHTQINKISTDSKTRILNPNLTGFLKEFGDDIEQVSLVYDTYKIDTALVNNINITNSTQLDKYNDIIFALQSLQSKYPQSAAKPTGHLYDSKSKAIKESKESKETKESKDKIKAYLDKTEINIPLNIINKEIKAQSNYITYIVESL